ncbi:NUDIX domain-containing protein [Winogradskyella maritima]|uniref:NUDIX hydrolase n=1 Tax=Winogradskyella maritima TaxID=1517766 RepID=A0ABV8ANV8_9FLAO|nr:NUDIX domain-containing protein [Winogradskyella maritima]
MSEYTVYVGDKPIVLTTDFKEEDNSKTFLLKSVKMGKVIKLLNKTDIAEVRLVDKNVDKLLKRFLKKLPKVTAGGGKVFNAKGDILFIYRNDKWDLPKGKTEKKESIEDSAIREVEEETGVKDLKIVKPLPKTYHIFKRNGRHKVKITHWFEMKTDYTGPLHPEENEGITKVEWLNSKSSEDALHNSYANIKLLF